MKLGLQWLLPCIFLEVSAPSAWAQTDTLAIEFNDGSVRLYPLAKVLQVSFAGTPTNAQEQELAMKALRSFALHQNFPNPFNPSTTIEYELPSVGEVAIEIFDLGGRFVRTLAQRVENAGLHRVSWDGRDDIGVAVGTGAYFCKVSFNREVIVRKLLLVK